MSPVLSVWGNERKGVAACSQHCGHIIEQCAARETLCRPTVWDDVRELILSSKLERNTHIATPAHIMHGFVIQTLSVCLPWEPAALSALSLPLCQPSGLRV